ncbi:MAG: restriction endonuclease subunit S [Selenomonadaceae bacterium]|nr:restriction endonuclease subunit S [Selenomonadaceae bacterium]
MKDSGVDWIGKIPEHWKISKNKYFLTMNSGDNIDTNFINNIGLYPVYGGNGLRGYLNRYNYEGEFLLIGRQGALSGNVHKVCNKFWATEHALVGTLIKKINFNYLYYVLDAENLNQYAFETAAQPGISISKIGNVNLPVPPLAEQQAIAAFLDDKCSQLDAVIAKKQQQVSILADYKKSLIYEYVTGKKEVTADEVH